MTSPSPQTFGIPYPPASRRHSPFLDPLDTPFLKPPLHSLMPTNPFLGIILKKPNQPDSTHQFPNPHSVQLGVLLAVLKALELCQQELLKICSDSNYAVQRPVCCPCPALDLLLFPLTRLVP